MVEGKIGEIQAKATLRRDVLRDINYLSTKGLISDNEVYYLIKNFLRNYLRLDYEFTKDELFEELKNVYLPYNIRSDFFKFIEKVFMFEYSQVSYSDEDLKTFLNEFKSYIDYLLVSTQERSKRVGSVVFKRWKDRTLDYFRKFRKHDVKKDDLQEKEVPHLSLEVMSPVMANHVEINSLLEKIYYSLYNSDLTSATDLYQKVVSLYNTLPPEEKASYYEVLNSVYDSIKKSGLSS
ncbi:MAG: hypothetical protein ISS25_02005 [Nanoarchaeota archaeon]|nr:hypothetical protein [DPANN group archaeon]MBL7116580.1 hypothetical protein [Nanoarchaeota archaeon]